MAPRLSSHTLLVLNKAFARLAMNPNFSSEVVTGQCIGAIQNSQSEVRRGWRLLEQYYSGVNHVINCNRDFREIHTAKTSTELEAYQLDDALEFSQPNNPTARITTSARLLA